MISDQQGPTNTVNGVGGAPLFPSEMFDSLVEPSLGCSKASFPGFPELLPHQTFRPSQRHCPLELPMLLWELLVVLLLLC